MKNIVKEKHLGITLTIIGIAMLSLNFLSYLMQSDFVSKIILPGGVLLLLTGMVLIYQTNNRNKKI